MVENGEPIVVEKSGAFHWKYSKSEKNEIESIVVAQFEYNFGNIKDCDNQSATTKIRNSKKAYNYWRGFKKKSMPMLQDKNQELSDCV